MKKAHDTTTDKLNFALAPCRRAGWLGSALPLLLGLLVAGCGPRTAVRISREPVTLSAPCARLSQAPVNLSDYKGRAVLLDFSATWLPSSPDNAALLNKLHDEYAARGLVVVGLLLDDETADATPFIEQNAIRYPVGLANELIQKEPFAAVRALPTKWLLDRSHRRVGEPLGGMLKEDQLLDHIEALLAL